jgi:hypothetical protein
VYCVPKECELASRARARSPIASDWLYCRLRDALFMGEIGEMRDGGRHARNACRGVAELPYS